MRSCHIGVDAVAHHGEFIALVAVFVANAVEHIGIGLSNHHIGLALAGAFNGFANGATVHQNHLLVGGAHPVGVGGDVGNVGFGSPPCGTTQARIFERGVERHHQQVGAVGGVIGTKLEAGFHKFFLHTRRAEGEEALGFGMMLTNVVDGCQRGGIHLLIGGVDAQFFEFQQIILVAFGGIIGEKRIADAMGCEGVEKFDGVGKQGGAHINGAIHIKCHVLDFCKGFHQFFFA